MLAKRRRSTPKVRNNAQLIARAQRSMSSASPRSKAAWRSRSAKVPLNKDPPTSSSRTVDHVDAHLYRQARGSSV